MAGRRRARSATGRWRRTSKATSPSTTPASARSRPRDGSPGARTRGSARTRGWCGCGTTTRNVSGRRSTPWDDCPVRDYPFLKGHGTENDFVLLPDHDGNLHADLTPERVRAICDRRAGIGGDGVLRVVRDDDGWFMDYRNADGSIAEMCGNGIRLFGRYLLDEGLVDGAEPFWVGTRDGRKLL